MQMQAPGRTPVADSLRQVAGNTATSQPPAPPLVPPSAQPVNRIVSALVLLALILFGGVLLFRAPHNGLAVDADDKELTAANLFKAWPRRPDLAIAFTGESKGYLQPCGCSEPQYGGLARRENLLRILKAGGWKVVAMDLGDMTQSFENKAADGFHGFPEMTDIKFRASMLALEKMIYGAVALGKQEYLSPLQPAIARHTANTPKPRVVATNLIKTGPGELWAKLNVARTELIVEERFKVGVISIVGPTVLREIVNALPAAVKADVDFVDPARAMEEGLRELKGKANIGVMLFQGDEKEAAGFVATAYKLYKAGVAPLLHAVLCMDRDSDPPDRPKAVDGIPTQIISVGHKGKNVGVLGLFRNETNLELRYQNIKLGPQFQPKEGDEKTHPVVQLMQDYADELKKGDYLGKIPRTMHPTQADPATKNAFYVGSERCGKCHDQIYADWEKTAHAHAYKTLENAKLPKGRQFDPECIVCHTVGYPYQTGFYNPPAGANLEAHNKKLHNVGCESCHGPGSEHVKNPGNTALYPIINPFRPSDKELDPTTPVAGRNALFNRRKNQIDWFCQKCHDLENDVNWGTVGFEQKYEGGKVIHLDPGPPPSRGHQAWTDARIRGLLPPLPKAAVPPK